MVQSMSASSTCQQYATICDGYGGEAGVVAKIGTVPSHQPAVVHHGSSLPFTGLDIGIMLVAAALLVLVGVTLRRAARQ